MADCIELLSDGSFDVDSVHNSDTLKLKGNQAFAKKSFDLAVEFYSQALQMDSSNHILYGNRSAAYWHLNQFKQALEDAQNAIRLNEKWVKGHFRKAAALASLKRYTEAYESYIIASKLAPKDKTLLLNAKKMKKLASSTTCSMKGFLSKTSESIYVDREDIIAQEVDERGIPKSSKLLLRKLRNTVSNQHNTEQFDGIFSKLMNECEFQRIIYPGVPKEKLSTVPKNFQELLNDPEYIEALEKLIPKVEAKVESVLENVKKRGAAEGDIMDHETEMAMRPQILNEAFAREVINMVNQVNSEKHASLSSFKDIVADPSMEYATWDQLEEKTLQDLIATSIGIGAQDDFMGEAWIELLCNDADRYKRLEGKLQPYTANPFQQTDQINGLLGHIEKADLDEAFPALAELMEKLHALPFEINKKAKLDLKVPIINMTTLHCLRPGESLPARIDGGRGTKDNGYAITCTYFFNRGWKAGDGGEMTLHNASAHVIEPQSDRLVILRSRDIGNSRAVVAAGAHDQYSVSFWIHGPELVAQLNVD